MPLTFHPFTLGLILVVAVGTVAWTLLSSNNQQQHAYGNSRRNVSYDRMPTTRCTTDDDRKKKKKDVMDDHCTICLGKLEGELRTLTCTHIFHSNCISMWLNNQPTCPICRKSL